MGYTYRNGETPADPDRDRSGCVWMPMLLIIVIILIIVFAAIEGVPLVP